MPTTARFFIARPVRLWRHVATLLPRATSLRPEFCGNFEQRAGYPPGARSQAFSLWSAFHERLLSRASRAILFLLPLPALVAIWLAIRNGAPQKRRWVEFAALLSGCCLLSFVTAAFGDALDNVKHMYLFNLLLDLGLLCAAAFVVELCRRFRSGSSTP